MGTAPDVDADSQAVMSPERAMRLWGRGGVAKTSGRSSCLSSRSNSVLTLTDTEHENKSDSDNGRTTSLPVSALVFNFFQLSLNLIEAQNLLAKFGPDAETHIVFILKN